MMTLIQIYHQHQFLINFSQNIKKWRRHVNHPVHNHQFTEKEDTHKSWSRKGRKKDVKRWKDWYTKVRKRTSQYERLDSLVRYLRDQPDSLLLPVLVQVEEMEERPGDLELGKATRRTRMFLSRRSCALIACDGWQNYTNFHLNRILGCFDIAIHYRKHGFPSVFNLCQLSSTKLSNGSSNRSIKMEEN